MKRTKKILFIIFLLFSQWSMGQMSNYKSLYIYNFIKRIEWPAAIQQKPFVIVVMGDHDTFKALKHIAENKNDGEYNFMVMEIQSFKDIQKADLVYVDYNKRRNIDELVNWIGTKPILLVSDYRGSKIVDIILMQTSDELSFVIRPKRIRKKGLKISDELIQLGKTDE